MLQNSKREQHWTISRGDTKYAGVLSYHPGIIFWKERLKVRLVALNKNFGRFKIRADEDGFFKLQISNLIGQSVASGQIVGFVESDKIRALVSSPVEGKVIQWTKLNGEVVRKNDEICEVRTHPSLLFLEVDYLVSRSGVFSCNAPISGVFMETIPLYLNVKQVDQGVEIKKNSILERKVSRKTKIPGFIFLSPKNPDIGT